ncbi:MAG: GNAT family N-acetyltransferase [Syntrophales bacterium]
MAMAENDGVIVRRMSREEVGLAVGWAAEEGWNPGLHDAECFYAADPQGFFLAERKGEPVGCVSAVAYDERFAFAGFYMVKKEWRGQGFGRLLVREASAYLGRRTVGNDAVPAQQETYRRYGFLLAYRNVRFRGVAPPAGGRAAGIVALDAVPFERLRAYDRELFPADRTAFLDCWIRQPGGAALGFLQDGRLSGYGVLRPCRQGSKIGPLFADSEAIAEGLLGALIAAIPGEEFFLDIPEPNPAARLLVERHGMTPVFETARMYAGVPPALPLERIFGVTSFELG